MRHIRQVLFATALLAPAAVSAQDRQTDRNDGKQEAVNVKQLNLTTPQSSLVADGVLGVNLGDSLTRLNLDEASPLKGRIQTVTNPGGIIKDNSILKMLENSLSDGVLYRLREGGADRGPDAEAMLGVLFSFWQAVAKVFAEIWELPAKRSRLVHGAGVVSLGFLMDAISERYRAKGAPAETMFAKDLKPLKAVCRWTDGHWEFGPGQQRKWNEVQNTTKDIQVLTNFLVVQLGVSCRQSMPSPPL